MYHSTAYYDSYLGKYLKFLDTFNFSVMPRWALENEQMSAVRSAPKAAF
jgi:hypothetical protein